MESDLHREGLECSSSNMASKEFQIASFAMQEIPEVVSQCRRQFDGWLGVKESGSDEWHLIWDGTTTV